MIWSLVAQVSAVIGVGELMRRTRCVPSLRSVMIREPPLPSSTASARYLPLGEKAAAVGDDASICHGVPARGNSTRPPGTSGAWVIAPSGVGVGLADGVDAAVAEADGELVADCGNRPAVLSSEPSGE